MKTLHCGLLTAGLCLLPCLGRAQQFGDFSYSSDGTNITIAKYTGAGGTGAIPSMITGLPVVSIKYLAFSACTNLTSVPIPNSVTSIGNGAFSGCSGLRTLFFRGNAPWWAGTSALDSPTVCYYLPGTSGWSASYGGRPAYLWNPAPQTADAKFGIRTNRFGFNITGTADIPIVVEASTNLLAATWVPLQTCTLTNGLIYFSDPSWTNYPTRSYRIRSP